MITPSDLLEMLAGGDCADAEPITPAPVTAELVGILRHLRAESASNVDLVPLVQEIVHELTNAWNGKDSFEADTDGALMTLLEKMRLFAPSAPAERSVDVASAPSEQRVTADYDFSKHGDVIDDFIVESEDLLDAMEKDLVNLSTPGPDTLTRLFRAAHTFKGNCGLIELKEAYMLMHNAENLLAKMRDSEITSSVEIENALLESVDYLREVVNRLKRRENPNFDAGELVRALRTVMSGDTGVTQRVDTPPAPPKSEKKNEPATPAANYIRVELKKLESVVAQVGELLVQRLEMEQHQRDLNEVIQEIRREAEKQEAARRKGGAASRTQTQCSRHMRVFIDFAERFGRTNEALQRSLSQLQGQVLNMRLVPLSQIFARFPRLVRDLSLTLGKKIEFVIEGDQTEIDKSVCELLPEPLIHLIRNSLDHGVEDPETRLKSGKPETGRVLLKAYYEGDKVAIEIGDDGKGMDADKIAAAAVSKNLINESECSAMNESQKLKLIFLPGFSTAEKVTNVSGRGVGMDVVRHTIEKFNGTVEIVNDPGRGATIKLKLPITMAILNTLMVKVGGSVLGMPLYNIHETVMVSGDEIFISGNQSVINLRGNIIPLVWTGAVLGMGESVREESRSISIVLVEAANRISGLVVDEFIGKRDVIIEGFGRHLKKLPYVSGCTIMGDGEIVLILDLSEVVRDAGVHRPSRENRVETSDSKKAAPTEQTGRKKVLVVEDSETMSKYLAGILRANGFAVDVAASGESGLEMAKSARYDVVSTDIVMPGMSGYDFVRELRKLDGYKITPVVALSQKGQKLDKIKGFEAGIDEYLAKPVSEDVYISVVTSLSGMQGVIGAEK